MAVKRAASAPTLARPERGWGPLARRLLATRFGPPAAALAAVIAAYWFYSLTAVPLIEPTASQRKASTVSKEDLQNAGHAIQQQREALSPWFQAGDWELDASKIIESDRTRLLVREYKNLADRNEVELTPFSMVLLPAGVEDEDERNRRAVVLQARDGAVLRFDRPIDLSTGKVGKVVGGKLRGEITIRSGQRRPGPEDDLLVMARDAELRGDQILSPHEVDVRLGPNTVHGRELTIKLDETPSGSEYAPDLGGLRWLQLGREVKMRMHPGDADLFGAVGPAPAPPTTLPPPAPNSPLASVNNVPLEVMCQGPFRFDLEKYVATFERQVDVQRMNPVGPTDQLNCEWLAMYFEDASGGAARTPKLEPQRIVATGEDLIIRAPSRGVQARGKRLEYELKARRGSLSGPDGWLRGLLPGEGDQRTLEARWRDALEIGPDPKRAEDQLISLHGAVLVNTTGVGELRAEEIFVWLIQQRDDASGRGTAGRWLPGRMMARNHVTIKSPQVEGEVGQLKVWLVHQPPAPSQPPLPGAVAGPPANEMPPPPDSTGELPAPRRDALAGLSDPSKPPEQRFHVNGDQVMMEVVIRGREPHLSRLELEGHMRLREIPLIEPSTEEPFKCEGDKLVLNQAAPKQAIVDIFGRPAKVEGRGVWIEALAAADAAAGHIHVDQIANSAAIKGPGSLVRMVDRDLDGKPLAIPRPLNLSWQGGMTFDGLVAVLRQDVVARLDEQRLTTDELIAQLAAPIKIGETAPGAGGDDIAFAEIACRGNVFIERRVLDQGALSALERMRLADLSINQQTGAMLGHGPGWVRTVRIDDGRALQLFGGQQPPAAAPPANASGLVYLGVDFQGELTGDQKKRVVRFKDRVQTIYGPAANWETWLDPSRPDAIEYDTFILNCNELEVLPTSTAPDVATADLEARGQVVLEGLNHQARYRGMAERLTYSGEKDQVVLEGSGNTPAALYRQSRPGAPLDPALARRFMFWPKTNRLQVDGVWGGEINSVPELRSLGPLRGFRR